VHFAGAVNVDHMGTGWSGWGALARACAIALVVLLLAGRVPASATAALGLGLAAIAALAGAVLFVHERGNVEGAPAAYRPPGGSAA
jgi:hypothetical protein